MARATWGRPDRAPCRLLQHALEGDVHPQPPQLLDHLPGAPHPVCPAALEKLVQHGRVGGQEIPQHVHLAPRSGGGELTPADHSHMMVLTRR